MSTTPTTTPPTAAQKPKQPQPKLLYFTAIRKDKAKNLFPIQCLTIGGIAFHARTAQYDFEAQEASYQPGQLQRLTEEQAAKCLSDAARLRVQWTRLEGGWKSEIVDPSSRIYEPLETVVDADKGNLLMSEEVELSQYVVLKRHQDADVPPVPPQAVLVATAPSPRAEADEAGGIEADEEARDPKGFAADKKERSAAKRGP